MANSGKITLAAILAAAALAGNMVEADQQVVRTVLGQNPSPCGGTSYATATMTNSSGTHWITPPNGTHTGTFTNASGLGAPFSCALSVVRKSDQYSWCDTNSLTFPATNSSYSMTVYVTSVPPPPTNNQPMTLEVIWK